VNELTSVKLIIDRLHFVVTIEITFVVRTLPR